MEPPIMEPKTPPAADAIANQSSPLVDVNLFTLDATLQEAVKREGGQGAAARLTNFGALTGSAEALEHGRLANENPPRLKTHDAKGRRLDTVEFHPSWHWLMAASAEEGLHCGAWGHLDGRTQQLPRGNGCGGGPRRDARTPRLRPHDPRHWLRGDTP